MKIRHAQCNDLARIQTIYMQARQRMIAEGNTSQWLNGYPSEALLRQDIAAGHLYVITSDNDETIHAVFAFILGEDPTYRMIEAGAWQYDGPYGTIHRIASDGSQRGILRMCVAHCLMKSRRIRVDTHADNVTMQAAILANGFVYSGIIYVSDGTPRRAYELQQ